MKKSAKKVKISDEYLAPKVEVDEFNLQRAICVTSLIEIENGTSDSDVEENI